jgi:hypothetical protein
MDDYQNASERHLQDAELLFAQAPKRLANASHLFGLSAECSLKAIARKFEPWAKFGGNKGHIPDLFSELQNISPGIGSNPDLVRSITAIKFQFANWTVAQRYASQITFVEGTVADEQTGANEAQLLMTNCLKGLI